MAKYTRGEFLGFGAALAGAFTLGRLPPVADVSRGGAAGGGAVGRARSRRRQRARADERHRAAARRGVCRQERPIHRGRFDQRRPQSGDARGRTVVDAQRMTVVARFHRRALPSERRAGAVRRQHQPAHRARDSGGDQEEGGRDAARVLGHRLHVRRHQARSAADPNGSRRGDDRAPGFGRASRRPHELLQQQGVRARRHHQGHARPGRRPLLPDNGELNGRVAENARDVFNRVGKRETFTPEQQRDRARNGMAHMSELFNAAGLTSVHNAGTRRSRSSPTRTAGVAAS